MGIESASSFPDTADEHVLNQCLEILAKHGFENVIIFTDTPKEIKKQPQSMAGHGNVAEAFYKNAERFMEFLRTGK